MPTTYTHDAFGKETYLKMPVQWKNMIKKHKKLYLIGLHGPDIFFYYRPYQMKNNSVVTFGHELHKKEVRSFFEEGIALYKRTQSEAVMTYLLGFCCHYILDSCCHPYVFAYQKKTGLAHGEIETNLDRFYMERDHKNPFTYKPASSICSDDETAAVIQQVFPVFSHRQIQRSLKGMKLYCGITVTTSETKRKLFHKALKLVGADREIGCRIIEKEPNPETFTSTKDLEQLYNQALEEIIPAMENLYDAMTGEDSLSQRFNRNFC